MGVPSIAVLCGAVYGDELCSGCARNFDDTETALEHHSLRQQTYVVDFKLALGKSTGQKFRHRARRI